MDMNMDLYHTDENQEEMKSENKIMDFDGNEKENLIQSIIKIQTNENDIRYNTNYPKSSKKCIKINCIAEYKENGSVLIMSISETENWKEKGNEFIIMYDYSKNKEIAKREKIKDKANSISVQNKIIFVEQCERIYFFTINDNDSDDNENFDYILNGKVLINDISSPKNLLCFSIKDYIILVYFEELYQNLKLSNIKINPNDLSYKQNSNDNTNKFYNPKSISNVTVLDIYYKKMICFTIESTENNELIKELKFYSYSEDKNILELFKSYIIPKAYENLAISKIGNNQLGLVTTNSTNFAIKIYEYRPDFDLDNPSKTINFKLKYTSDSYDKILITKTINAYKLFFFSPKMIHSIEVKEENKGEKQHLHLKKIKSLNLFTYFYDLSKIFDFHSVEEILFNKEKSYVFSISCLNPTLKNELSK